MKINLANPNSALISIIDDPNQIITLDANFLIAPDRRPIAKRGIRFEHAKRDSSPPQIIIHKDNSLNV